MALALLFTLPAGPLVQGKMKNSLTASTAPGLVVTAHFGRKKKSCKGVGICDVVVGDSSLSDRAVRATLSANADGNLTVAFLAKPPEDGPTLFIDEDITLPPAIAKELGFKSATALKGEYAFNSRRSLINARLVK